MDSDKTQTPPGASPEPQKLGALVKPFDPDLRRRLLNYRDANKLTNAQLGAQLGVGVTQVSKYMNGVPEGDVARLEAVAEDVLKNASTRVNSDVAHFETPVTRVVHSSFQTILRTNDVGLIYGDAGIGKSCGVTLYAQAHPSAIAVTLTKWQRDVTGLEALIFHQLETRTWDNRSKRGQYIADKLKGSNRLVIIDNAHRLTVGGLQWIFDMHDETGTPFALSGNPEVLDQIRKNDQMFSRIGLKRLVQLSKRVDIAAVTDEMLSRLAPGMADELRPLARQVVTARGHMRALRKQLMLTAELLSANTGKKLSATEAFRAAHTRLVRDYDLDLTGTAAVGGAQ